LCEFNKQDILAVAKGVDHLKNILEQDDGKYYARCYYCNEEAVGDKINAFKKIQHDPDCPYLSAQKILKVNL